MVHYGCPNGPVAQLGERYIRIVEVSGSSPLRSTTATCPRRECLERGSVALYANG